MPQMAPLNWLGLFLFFICMFFLINVLVYYSFSYISAGTLSNYSSKVINWKW